MARKTKTIGQQLAEMRWKKTTPEQRKEHGRKLTDLRKAKRAAPPKDEPK